MSARPRSILALAVPVLATWLAGCGLAAHTGTAGVRITITRDFGARVVRVIDVPASSRSLTPLALLQREARVSVGPGAHVRSIDGLSAGPGEHWSHFVNGIGEPDLTARQAAEQLPAPVVHAGDQIWWDLHSSRAAAFVPAVVGAFPEPFRHGALGKRFPTTLECAADVAGTCQRVSGELAAAGVAAPTQELGTGSGQDTIGVLVGPWAELRGTLLAALLDAGPGASGIDARFADGGRTLQLLGPDGAVVRTLGAGAGLVAAARDNSDAPTWLITGTDAAGVRAAAAAVSAATLHDRYAVAVWDGTVIPLPVA
jgi:hypothetical protein